MSLKQQVVGLNEFLSDVYRTPTRLSKVLETLDLSPTQIETLHKSHAALLTAELLDALGMRMRGWAKGSWVHTIIFRRYGLDGHPPDSVEALGRQLGLATEDVRELGLKALTLWRRKPTLAFLERSAQQIALGLLANPNYGKVSDGVRARLSELRQSQADYETRRGEYAASRASILAPLQPALDALDAGFKPALNDTADRLRQLTEEICTEVLLLGASVHADEIAAVFREGRTLWDDAGLLEYAAQHPEVLQYRKVGLPSVSIEYVSNAQASGEAQPSDDAD